MSGLDYLIDCVCHVNYWFWQKYKMPPVGIEPTHLASEASALSAELRGHRHEYSTWIILLQDSCWFDRDSQSTYFFESQKLMRGIWKMKPCNLWLRVIQRWHSKFGAISMLQPVVIDVVILQVQIWSVRGLTSEHVVHIITSAGAWRSRGVMWSYLALVRRGIRALFVFQGGC